jgi:hypothetical protein
MNNLLGRLGALEIVKPSEIADFEDHCALDKVLPYDTDVWDSFFRD